MKMNSVFFLFVAMFFCLTTNVHSMDHVKWDLDTRIALGEFDVGKSKVTKGMEISLLSIAGLTVDKMLQIEVRTDQVGSVDQNQQLADERGRAVQDALQKLVPITKSTDMKIEVVTKRHDQDGVDVRGAWIAVYKPHQEVVVEKQYAQIPVVSVAVDTVGDNKTNQDQVEEGSGWTIKPSMILLVVIVVGLILIPSLFMRSRRPAAVLVETKKDIVEASEAVTEPAFNVIDKDRLNSLQYYDAEQPCAGFFAETQFEIGDVKLYVICDEKDAAGGLKTFHVKADKGIYYAYSEKKWRHSTINVLRHWLYKMSESTSDFSALEEAIQKRLVTRLP